MDKPFQLVDKVAGGPQSQRADDNSPPTMNSIEVWRHRDPFLEIDQFVARTNVWPPLSVRVTVSAHYERLGERFAAMWRLFWFGDTHTTIMIGEREAQHLAEYLKDASSR